MTEMAKKDLMGGAGYPKNQLQEMILEKFLGNSSKKVNTVGESGEIPHFCYLGSYMVD